MRLNSLAWVDAEATPDGPAVGAAPLKVSICVFLRFLDLNTSESFPLSKVSLRRFFVAAQLRL